MTVCCGWLLEVFVKHSPLAVCEQCSSIWIDHCAGQSCVMHLSMKEATGTDEQGGRDSNEGEKRVQELLGHSDFGFPKGALCKRKCDIRVRKRRGGRREWTAKRGLVEMGMCMGGDRP